MGVPTNAIYAFVGMIRKLIASENPDNLIVVFDSRGPSFREEISREYKAQRPAMPDNLSLQVPFVKEIIDAMGLPVVEKEGFEADDIIATITEHLKTRDNVMTFIVTGDKDMMQLVGDRVRILDSMKNVVIGEAEVTEKFGVPPRNVVDYLSLCGDTSDNIPGVPGIGEKTARELVSSLGSVENIYARVDEMKRKAVRERLIAGREKAEMSKKLATLRYDVPIEAGVEGLAAKPPDLETLRRLYRELEFTALYREVRVQGKEKKDVKEKALADLAMDRVSIAGSFQGKNAGDLELLAFAAFDGEGVFLSDDVADLAVVLRSAKEVIGHDLKAFFVVAGDLLQRKRSSTPCSPPISRTLCARISRRDR
jgi:DNA polymerase-1